MLKAALNHWISILVQAVRIWLDSNAFAIAGSLAFFTLFSIAPVVIVIVSIIGFFFGEEAAQGQIVVQLEQTIGTEAATAVQTAVAQSQLQGGGIWATTAGVLAMLVGATTVFAQMQTALNTIWGVAPRPSRNSLLRLIRKRVASLTIVLAIGFIMLVSLSLSLAVNAAVQLVSGWLPWQETVLRILELGVSLAVISFLFMVIFKSLPDVRLKWSDVLLGGVVTAVLFTVGRSLIALYLAYTATASTFGAAASLVLLLLWVNYSSLILLFGAAFTRARFEASGGTIIPRSVAVRVHKSLVEE